MGKWLISNSDYTPTLHIERTKELSRSIREVNVSFVACKFPTLARIVNISSEAEDDKVRLT